MVGFLRYLKALGATQKKTVLVVGDVMIDEYIWGKVSRISPEAPVPVVEAKSESHGLGGACNVVQNLRALGSKVYVAGVVGNDLFGDRLVKMLTDEAVETGGILVDPSRPTTVKTRIMAQNQQIARIDKESRERIAPNIASSLCHYVESIADRIDVFLISDYAKGVITQDVSTHIIDIAKRCGKPVLVDPKGTNYIKYYGTTLITPNRYEAETVTGIKITDENSLVEAGDRLLEITGCEAAVITLDTEGMAVFEANGAVIHIPAVPCEVFDVTGAGDTVVSAMAMGVSCGLGIVDAAIVSTFAASVAVRKIGVAAVSVHEIENVLSTGYDLVITEKRSMTPKVTVRA